jgi:hypothetical protein
MSRYLQRLFNRLGMRDTKNDSRAVVSNLRIKEHKIQNPGHTGPKTTKNGRDNENSLLSYNSSGDSNNTTSTIMAAATTSPSNKSHHNKMLPDAEEIHPINNMINSVLNVDRQAFKDQSRALDWGTFALLLNRLSELRQETWRPHWPVSRIFHLFQQFREPES